MKKTIARCTVRYGAYRVRVLLGLGDDGLWHVPVRRGYPKASGGRGWGGEHTYDEEMSVQGIDSEHKARLRFALLVTFIASNYVFPARSK